jgi:glutamate formiminotransferase
MTARLLEAVPNFSEGRNADVIHEIVGAMSSAPGAAVLDWSADADHHRSVVTVVGEPHAVEQAAFAGASVAVRRIDLREHRGVHPRIGALDVLPFVPLMGLSMADARQCAHRVGARIARDLGVPVFFYGQASDPPGRTLAELRRGGYEALVDAWPQGRRPSLLPDAWPHAGAHPAAGATCVGARELLLAWNVVVRGITLETAAAAARGLRERDGGFPGLRALALWLPGRGVVQISMNLERLGTTAPMTVFRRLEELVERAGGEIAETEVIGMMPDDLVVGAAAERLRMPAATTERLLSRRLLEVLGAARMAPVAEATTDSRNE